MEPRPTTWAVVLAAGAASRFGGAKLVADLIGRPILGWVTDAARASGVAGTIVVLGHGQDAIRDATAWHGERIAVNPDPDAGLSSSLRVGLAALPAGADAAVVLLGDQPLVDPATIRTVLDAPIDPDRPIVAPRYATDGAPNPVRIERTAWPLVDDLTGERGFGAVIAARPELVRWVDVPGANPDVDTRADLAMLAWAARVRANREQVDRLRETPDGRDFYGPVSSMFVADPHRTDDAVLDGLVALTRPPDVWLDIGAGAGRYALPLALRVAEVIAVDPSTSMLEALRQTMTDHAIGNVVTIEGRWPLEAADGARLAADVVLIAHVGYDVEGIGPFLVAMEVAAARLCVAVMMTSSPAIVAAPFWPPVHGEERVALPALPEFVDVLRSRGREPTVRIVLREPRIFDSPDELERMVRRQLWVGAGTTKERLMLDLLDAWTVEVPGGFQLRDQRPAEVGIVTWTPGG